MAERSTGDRKLKVASGVAAGLTLLTIGADVVHIASSNSTDTRNSTSCASDQTLEQVLSLNPPYGNPVALKPVQTPVESPMPAGGGKGEVVDSPYQLLSPGFHEYKGKYYFTSVDDTINVVPELPWTDPAITRTFDTTLNTVVDIRHFSDENGNECQSVVGWYLPNVIRIDPIDSTQPVTNIYNQNARLTGGYMLNTQDEATANFLKTLAHLDNRDLPDDKQESTFAAGRFIQPGETVKYGDGLQYYPDATTLNPTVWYSLEDGSASFGEPQSLYNIMVFGPYQGYESSTTLANGVVAYSYGIPVFTPPPNHQ